MFCDIVRARHADIISLTRFRSPNYEVIDFQQFVCRYLGTGNCFIQDDVVSRIRDKFREKNLNEYSCFPEMGYITDAQFAKMKFYQKEVGINGPKHSSPNELVYILLFDDQYILWNGYHRTLIKMVEGQSFISGFLMSFD